MDTEERKPLRTLPLGTKLATADELDALISKITSNTQKIRQELPDFTKEIETIEDLINEFRKFARAFAADETEIIPFGDGSSSGGSESTDEVVAKILAQKTAIDALSPVTQETEVTALRTTVNSIITILQNIVA
jgi:hypothetical protein